MFNASEYKIPHHSNLTKDEEAVLVRNWQTRRCEVSRCKLIKHNLKFVAGIAALYRNKFKHVPFPDLVSYGIFGLYRAIETFDPSMGYVLRTHANNWVRQKIIRGVEDNESLIRTPANIHEKMRRKLKDGVDLDDTEKAIMDNVRGVNRLDDIYGDGKDNSGLGITVVDKFSFINHTFDLLPDYNMEKKQRDDMVIKAVSELPKEERDVVNHMFGIGGYTQHNLRETGKSLGVSHEKIRKIKAQSIERLRYIVKKT